MKQQPIELPGTGKDADAGYTPHEHEELQRLVARSRRMRPATAAPVKAEPAAERASA